MNTTPTPPPVDEHDWQAQERSLDRPARRVDAVLARALGELPVSEPPADFAASVVRRVASRGVMPDESVLERRLQPLLFAVLALGGAIATAFYGDAIWTATINAFGAGASQWLLVGGACLALAAAPDALRRMAGQFAPGTA